MIKSHELKEREQYLNKLIGFQDTEPIKVVTGIRRSGRLEFTPPCRGILWRALLPFRRIILGVYRRVKPSDFASL